MASPKLTQQDGHGLKFCSWNCRGFNNPVKRSKVLHHLQHMGAKIIYLQETHLRVSDQTRLKASWIGHTYHSSFQGRSRGVAIILHKSIPFVCSNVIADPNGRYLIVSGIMFNTPVLLVNIYGPNWDDDGFFKTLFSTLPDISSHFLILGGDFNCWLDPKLDRSSTRHCISSRSARVIQSFKDQFALSDPWRFFNPSGKEYSFFSNVHHTFTRIDYFLVDNRILPSVKSISYNAIVISDHAPVTMNIHFKGSDNNRAPWRFNNRLLSNEGFVELISNQIDFFLSVNKTPDVSASVLWETLKAYIRGEIISYSGYERKVKREKLAELTKRIAQLDTIYATTPSPDLYKDRLSLQAEFEVLATDHTMEMLLKSRYTYYEHGDKAGRLLAYQLRQTTSSHQIPQIQTSSGLTIEPKKINDEFRDFYTSLYTSENTADSSHLDGFFDSLDIPTVHPDFVEDLERNITVEELTTAAISMQCGKCPGPDGYPAEFYKKFLHKLAPILIDMFNESFESLKLPQTLTQASISLILKKNKDPLSCASYRPISLLNVDFKLLSKLLALRLESTLPSIISPDQTGFIKNRHSFFNLRRLFNTIYNPSTSAAPEALISLDAEKAFDRVEWGYLFHTLDKFGFGKKFITWVKLLYSSPQASVRTNNTQSEYFPLHRSTRQGCPLSPLLFAVAIEPLAIALRSNPRITGIARNGTEQRVSLYADDLLLYISNLAASVPAALATLKSFSFISGYKLNLGKSELFPLNATARKYPLHNFPFKISLHSFTYLGIQVTSKFRNLFKANFTPCVARMQQDFERWSLLPLNLAARINSVKMNTLPKFSYLFQCIPIFLPQAFFRKIDSLILEFIWNKKPPRLRRDFLQRPKPLGGMALPNFRFYYWATNLRILQYWFRSDAFHPPPAWLAMESFSSKPVSLTALVHSPINCSFSPYVKNIIVKTTLRIWNQFKRHFGLQTFSTSAPLVANHAFAPSISDGAFSIWSNLGIKQFKDLYVDNIFASFQQLSELFSLPRHHFFRYLQIRSFIRSKYPKFPNLPEDTPLDAFLTQAPMMKGMISYIYSQIQALSSTSLNSVKALWEEELGEGISEELWGDILKRVHTSSACARHGLIQCKVVHRTHWTKVRLSKIYDNIDPSCEKCHQIPANHLHMFWSCPSLYNYWTAIFNTLTEVTGTLIEPNAITALFGIPQLPLPRLQADLIAFVTLLARRLILMRWKSPIPPSHTLWLKEIFNNLQLEKIRYTLKGSYKTFKKVWGSFFAYADKITFPVIPE